MVADGRKVISVREGDIVGDRLVELQTLRVTVMLWVGLLLNVTEIVGEGLKVIRVRVTETVLVTLTVPETQRDTVIL